MGAPIIFSGSDAKLLKSNLDFNGQSKILSGSVDPTSVATSAPIGSLYLNSSTGAIYKKNDAGSTTNWSLLGTSTTNSTAARYYSSSTTISGSLATIVYATKDYDTASAYSAGVFTAPVAGKYVVAAGILIAGTIALNNTLVLEIQKNSSVVSRFTEYFPATLTDGKALIVDTITLAAGDTVRIQASTSVTGPSIVSSNFDNYFSIALVAASPSGTLSMATIQDQKTAGTYGGTFTAGAWQTRTLNTLNDPNSIVTSLSSNQFVLPAGSYHIAAFAPARTVSRHRAKLYNVTDAADAILGQTSGAPVGTTVMTSSIVDGLITIAAPKTFEIRHYCSSTEGTDGFGDIAPDGVAIEVYTQVRITKTG